MSSASGPTPPAPHEAADGWPGYAVPVGEAESAAAEIWSEVLGVARVGRGDDFFDLGGDSLDEVQVISRVKEVLGVELEAGALFDRPVLADFARGVEEAARAELPAIGAVDRAGRLALSFAQQRLWFIEQLGAGGAYNLPRQARLRGALDAAALARALDRVVARHEALRTTFHAVDGEPEQRIAPAGEARFTLVEHDLRGRGDAAAELDRLVAWEAGAPFDLERGPLFRGRLVRLADDDHVLLVTMHHIISDAWSMEVLVDELDALYATELRGAGDPLPPLPVQYADYAAWQRRWVEGEVLEKQAAYWTGALAGAPAALELPLDRPRPARQEFAGASVRLALDEELAAGLKALGRRHGTTLFMTLLAGWAVVLSRLSGQAEVVVGSPTANRGRRETEGLIGLFVNSLAMRVDLSGSPAVGELLARVKARALEARHNQDIPFEQVVERVEPERSLARNPVFQVMFAWQNVRRSRLALPGAAPAFLERSRQATAKFDLELRLWEAGGRIEGWVEYAASLFDPATVERHVGYLRRVLEEMAADDGRRVEALDLLPQAERRRVVEEWNATDAEYPADASVHALFEARVGRCPEAVAVVEGTRSLTYAELDARAGRLARLLRERGVEPGARVAVLVPRSIELVVAELAVLKAGAAYVPVDPTFPAGRIAFMVADSGARTVLALAGAALPDLSPARRIDVDVDVEAESSAGGGDGVSVRLGGGAPAYVMYTSGSTGEPKGVVVPHRAVARLVVNNASLPFGADDRVAFAANPTFDATTLEVWGPLLNGGRVVVVGHEELLEPRALARVLEERGITLLFVTTAVFNQLAAAIPAALASLRVLYTGGERADPASFARVLREGGRVSLVHAYGPTETTTFALTHPVESVPEGARSVPLGLPISNTRAYVLDRRGAPAPVGAAGELCLGGPGVAHGYLDRPRLTAERFVPDPFGGEPGARLYRTGDLARRLADGTVEFLGRNDFQVKLRGFRIEPGEVEARLLEHPEVREAVVVAREDTPGDRRLVAYCVGGAVEAEALRAHLSATLPEYMVPAAYVRLERLPLTPSGKLDRGALPSPEGDAYARRGYEAPVGETETALAELWQELLGVERVGRWDRFFELGGHSLMAVKLAGRLRQRGLHVEVGALFARPALAELAAEVGRESLDAAVPPNAIPTPCEAITPRMLPLVELGQAEIDRIVAGVEGGAGNVQDVYPLAPLQEGILFHHLLAREGDPYLLVDLPGFDSRERLDAYVDALRALVDRHDVLRTSVAWEGLREPVQVVWRRVRLEVEEVELDPAGGDAARQLRARFDPRRTRLDVRRAPLMRLYAARDAAGGRWVLLHQLHHLVADHVTKEAIQDEIQAHLLGCADQLPAPLPFRNYVAQTRRGTGRTEHEAYFRALLGGVDEPTAPFGLLDAWGDGSGIEEARLPVDAGLAARLRERARRLGVSAASVCHLAWALVLARASGRGDVVFGTLLFGRMRGGEGAERVMGPFINTLPVRVRVGSEGVEAGVRGMHRQLAELLRHEHASLALAQRCSGVEAPAPLFTALLNYRHSRGDAPTAEDRRAWEGIQRVPLEERTNYPVTLSVDDLGEGFGLKAQVPASVGAERVCAMVHRALERLVEALETAPERALRRVDVLPAAERRQVVDEWNRTDAGYPDGACVHQLFEAQAERTPDAAAVAFEDEALSYAELNARANRLARFLVERGVGPDARVGLCVERGPEMVVGVLGVMKAGGAYVPLDPEYPEERLRYMLQDSAPAVLLTQASIAGRFGGMDVPVVALDADAPSWADRSDANPGGAGLTPEHLAYVIYTSGSTGRPKGVMVRHGGVANYVTCAVSRYAGEGAADFPLYSSLSFDLTVTSLFVPLVTGGRIVVAPKEAGDRALLRVFEEDRVDVVKLTPSHLALLAERDLSGLRIRRLVVGGEDLKAPLARAIHEASAGRLEIYNEYGPTEATVGCVVRMFNPGHDLDGSVPIGAPIASTRVYVLDGAGEPAPVGVAGELYAGGEGVARGYLGRPALTAERFVPDPFGGRPGARLYRTGDRARWRADGTLEYLGRGDDQVKVRGYRIEPGEVEARLAEHAGVREAVVVAREDTPGDRRLVAYYTAAAGAVEVEALRAHLSERLPEHMVPAAYVALGALPLTPNGKVDRRALPSPDGDAFARRGYEPPEGETEAVLAEIWSELLGVERVGRWDNFFALGGHSLLMLRLIPRMRRRGLRAEGQALFMNPTLAGMAALVGAGRAEVVVPPNLIPQPAVEAPAPGGETVELVL